MRQKIDWDKIDEQDLVQEKINKLLFKKDSKIVIDAMLLTCVRFLGDDFTSIAKDFVNFVKEEKEKTA